MQIAQDVFGSPAQDEVPNARVAVAAHYQQPRSSFDSVFLKADSDRAIFSGNRKTLGSNTPPSQRIRKALGYVRLFEGLFIDNRQHRNLLYLFE